MLDEEVEFTLQRKLPRSKSLEKIDQAASGVAIVGGAAGGVWLLKYVLGGCCGFFLGAPIGAIIGYYVKDAAASAVTYLPRKGYQKLEERLDSSARAKGANAAAFTYRGNEVECVIRPAYEKKGHIFYMSIDDGFILNPTFSYQPKRRACLGFRFDIPKFESEEDDAFQHLDEDAGDLSAAIRSHKDESADSIESRYIGLLEDKIPGEGYRLKFQGREKSLRVILTFNIGNYDTELRKFARIASQLMDYSKEFIGKNV